MRASMCFAFAVSILECIYIGRYTNIWVKLNWLSGKLNKLHVNLEEETQILIKIYLKLEFQ